MKLRHKRQKIRHPKSRKAKLLRLGIILLPLLIGGGLFALWYYKEPLLYSLELKKEVPIVKPVVSSNSTLELEKILRKSGLQFDQIKRSSGSARLYTTLTDGPTVVFSDSKDPQVQVSSLQLILTRLTIEQGKNAKMIDMRFNKPVVKF